MNIPALMWWEGGSQTGVMVIGSTDCPVCHQRIGGTVQCMGVPTDREKVASRERILSGVEQHMLLHEKEGVHLNTIEQPKNLPEAIPMRKKLEME